MQEILTELRKIIIDVLDAIIARSESNDDYPFIDTKLNVRTGDNIYPASPGQDYNNKDVIFSWIQGRGLEAFAEHAHWLEKEDYLAHKERIMKIRCILEKVITAMEKIRAQNNGRMFFMMTTKGEFLQIASDARLVPVEKINSGSNYSDLFYAKGLLTAAAYLGKTNLVKVAEDYFEKVIDDIIAERFASDQQPFDPKNKVAYVPGKRMQGSRMISLGGMAVAAQICDSKKWLMKACDTIEYIFNVHINTGQFEELEQYDFWEAVDVEGIPYEEDGKLLCDPGHALEFVGLALKCILQIKPDMFPRAEYFIDKYKRDLPLFFRHNFDIGYQPEVGGIIKSFDLYSRQPINTDMPWWSLPETIRAAAELYDFIGDESLLTILQQCAGSFLNNYVNPDVYSMAYQTRNAQGDVVDVIPATPDADPGYHTGISLIDTLNILNGKNC